MQIVVAFVPLGAFLVMNNPKLRELILGALAGPSVNSAGNGLLQARTVNGRAVAGTNAAGGYSLDAVLLSKRVKESALFVVSRGIPTTGNLETSKLRAVGVQVICLVVSDDQSSESRESSQLPASEIFFGESVEEAVGKALKVHHRITLVSFASDVKMPSFADYMLGLHQLIARRGPDVISRMLSEGETTTANASNAKAPASGVVNKNLSYDHELLPIVSSDFIQVTSEILQLFVGDRTRLKSRSLDSFAINFSIFLRCFRFEAATHVSNGPEGRRRIEAYAAFLEASQSLPSAIRQIRASLRTVKFALRNESFAANTKASETKTILFVQPISGGGLLHASNLLAEVLSKKFRILILSSSGLKFTIRDYVDNVVVFDQPLTLAVDSSAHRSPDYDGALARAILELQVSQVHVEHMAWQSLGLGEICQSLLVPYSVSIHDFYFACASHTLLDDRKVSCAGVCTPGLGSCNVSLWPSADFADLKNNRVFEWRGKMGVFLEGAALLIAPTNFAANQIRASFPNSNLNFQVIPHALQVQGAEARLDKSTPERKVKVLVLGEVTFNKGAAEISGISREDKHNEIDFHFVGQSAGTFRNVGVHHGPYRIMDLSRIMAEINPDVAIFPAIGPETFSFTLSEVWSNGVPVVARDLGAIAERVAETGCGILVNKNATPRDWLEALLKFRDPTIEFEIGKKLREWNQQNSVSSTQAEMLNRYHLAFCGLQEIEPI